MSRNTLSTTSIRAVKADWQGIQRTADSWGFTIDLDTNAISYTPPPDAARAAQKARRCDLLHQRILDVLTRAEGADDELAAAIRGAAGLATPDGVTADANPHRPPLPMNDQLGAADGHDALAGTLTDT